MHALRPSRRAVARRLVIAAALLALGRVPCAAQPAPAVPKASARIALVPLDDRPISLQYPTLLGAVADATIVTPPRGVLGRHLRAGDGEAIARWLDGLDLMTLDAVVVSADMLAYGGLVGSRVLRVFENEARHRLEAIGRLKQRRPELTVFVIGTVPRHAPTDDGSNEKWRAALTRWAEVAGAPDAGATAETAAIEKTLPAGMVDRYRATRARNLAVDLALVESARSGAIDLLVFGRDDPSPRGVQAADTDALAAAIEKAGVVSRVRMQPGADEIALLLVTRALTTRFKYRPEVQAIYSTEAAPEAVTPDGRSLKDVVAAQVAAAGGQVVERAGPAVVRLFVHASLKKTPPAAEAFAARVGQAVNSGARAVVADVNLAGEPNGSSMALVEGLRGQRLLPRLFGYASSDAAGGSTAVALAQGLVLALGVDRLSPGKPEVARRVATAHVRLLLHRYVADFLYQHVVRGQAVDDLLAPRRMNPLRLDDNQKLRVEKYLLDELMPLAEGLVADFAAVPWRLPGSARGGVALQVRDITDFTIGLPWARLSEAEIDFTLVAPDAGGQPRPPRPRVIR